MWRALSLYWAFCKYRNVQFWSCSSKVFYCCLLTRLKSIVNFASLPQISGEFSFNRKAHSKRYLFRTEKKIWGSWHVTSAQKLWKNVVKFDQFDKKKTKASVNADFADFGIFWQLLASFGIFQTNGHCVNLMPSLFTQDSYILWRRTTNLFRKSRSSSRTDWVSCFQMSASLIFKVWCTRTS